MVQSPSWAADWLAASQEIPRISQNPKVHYHIHKRPPPVSMLDQPNPVHIPTSHLLEIHPNIIHSSTPRSSQWSPSLRFPHQDPMQPLPLLTHTHHMPSSSHSNSPTTVIILNGNFTDVHEISTKTKRFMLYSFPYNKKVYNLMMAYIKAETCSCWDKLWKKLLSNINITSCVWLYLIHVMYLLNFFRKH